MLTFPIYIFANIESKQLIFLGRCPPFGPLKIETSQKWTPRQPVTPIFYSKIPRQYSLVKDTVANRVKYSIIWYWNLLCLDALACQVIAYPWFLSGLSDILIFCNFLCCTSRSSKATKNKDPGNIAHRENKHKFVQKVAKKIISLISFEFSASISSVH